MTSTLPAGATELLDALCALHDSIRDQVVASCERRTVADLARVDREDESDTQYAIDAVGEERLEDGLAAIARRQPLLLLAEGLPSAGLVLPRDAAPDDVVWRVLVDPIDGTRGLMYQKRSAWVLSAAAPARGAATRLSDAVLAVQTEIPLVKQHLADQLTAVRGRGAEVRRFDRLQRTWTPIRLEPSRAASLAHGFATFARFFPGVREELGALDEEVMRAVLGPPVAGRVISFEDQYLSSAGQLYELTAGHDRFVTDLRPLFNASEVRGARAPLLCCHPYDLCTALIAAEHGVIVTDPEGRPLDAPFDVATDVAWVGYANARIREAVEPALQAALRRRGLLGPEPTPFK